MKKTAPKTVGRPFLAGTDPRRGFGKKGRSGRKPFEITQAAQDAVTENDLIGEVVRIATQADRESDRLAAIRLLLDRGFGQAAQRVEHTGEDGGPIEFVHDARDTFTGRMDRLVTRLDPGTVSPLTN